MLKEMVKQYKKCCSFFNLKNKKNVKIDGHSLLRIIYKNRNNNLFLYVLGC